MHNALSKHHHQIIGTRVKFFLKSVGSKNRFRTGQIVSKHFLSNAHLVFNLNWKESEKFAVSFFLAKDHRFDATTQLFVIDAGNNKILIITSLKSQSMQQKCVKNPKPSRRFIPLANPSNADYFLRCKDRRTSTN